MTLLLAIKTQTKTSKPLEHQKSVRDSRGSAFGMLLLHQPYRKASICNGDFTLWFLSPLQEHGSIKQAKAKRSCWDRPPSAGPHLPWCLHSSGCVLQAPAVFVPSATTFVPRKGGCRWSGLMDRGHRASLLWPVPGEGGLPRTFLCLLSLENNLLSHCQWEQNMMLKESCNNLWMTKIFFFLIFECDLCHFYRSCWGSQWVSRSLFTTSSLCAGQDTKSAYANLQNWDRC